MAVENLDGEIWRYVMSEELGFYPYQISNFGRVKSLNYKGKGKEWILKAKKNKDGYLQVNLYQKGKRKTFQVHRLVGLMFLPNPENLPCVNHKDEDKTNNLLENLEFCSVAYNNSYGTRLERVEEKKKETIKISNAWKEGIKKRAAKRSKQVYQYTTDGELVNIYPSAHEAERQTGYVCSSICAVCRGEQKSHKKFIWSYSPIETSTNQLTLFPLTEKKIS